MGKIATIFILVWVLLRLVFHSFDFSNSEITSFIYFASNDVALIGFFLMLYSFANQRRFSLFMGRNKFKKLILSLIIYSIWCFIVDILLLISIGTHDFTVYTAISMGIISIGALWASYV